MTFFCKSRSHLRVKCDCFVYERPQCRNGDVRRFRNEIGGSYRLHVYGASSVMDVTSQSRFPPTFSFNVFWEIALFFLTLLFEKMSWYSVHNRHVSRAFAFALQRFFFRFALKYEKLKCSWVQLHASRIKSVETARTFWVCPPSVCTVCSTLAITLHTGRDEKDTTGLSQRKLVLDTQLYRTFNIPPTYISYKNTKTAKAKWTEAAHASSDKREFIILVLLLSGGGAEKPPPENSS